jgi:hypothetical protein
VIEVGSVLGAWHLLYQGVNTQGRQIWLGRCRCLIVKELPWWTVRRGGGKPCECFYIKPPSAYPEHHIWRNMNSRCLDPTFPNYDNYGGRGITVCEEWINSFESFFHHIGARPTPNHTLDRINNDLGYFPGNVRWATRTEQARNKRNNRLLTWNGETLPIPVWAERTGLNEALLWTRVRARWSDEKTLTTPPLSPPEIIAHLTSIRLQRTSCVHGHTFTEENTRMVSNGSKTFRLCRTCERMTHQRYKQRKHGKQEVI